MSQHAVGYDARGRRLVAPIGLIVAAGLIAFAAWRLAPDLEVRPATIPVESSDTAADAIPERGPQALVVIHADTPSSDVVELVEAITAQASEIPGIRRVESATDVGVVTSLSGALASTPAFGSSSSLDRATGLAERARRADAGQLGSAGLVTPDATTFLVAAELDPAMSPAQQDAAARAVRDRAALAVSVSGLDVEASYAGQALTAAEAGDAVRSDLWLLVGLAVLAPAAIALVILRRRVPAGAVLAAGGAALLLASLLVNNEAAQGRTLALDRNHPVARANDLVDSELRGTIPVTVDITGAPGAFRRPDVLARLDALSTWLREEYGIEGTDLTTTLRAEAEAITGVDSIPSKPEDIESLLMQAESFDGGAHLARVANDDFSRTRIIAWVPDDGRARLEELANRLDRISVVVFDDFGISVQVGSEVVTSTAARQHLATDLALLGMLAIALAAAIALATLWDRHRHEERHRARHRRLFGPTARHPSTSTSRRAAGHGEPGDPSERSWRESLFARHGHRIRTDGPKPPTTRSEAGTDRDREDDDRFSRSRRSGAGSR